MDTLFINEFQKGSSENGNIGFAAMVGCETYSDKGVLQLTKDTTKTSGSIVVDLPVYFTSATENVIFSQGDTGHIYKSTDTGATWIDITYSGYTPTANAGQGLIFYKPNEATTNGFLFSFLPGQIDYCVSPYAAGNWTTAWKSNPSAGLITGVPHFPFISPGDGQLYFANGSYVGKIGTVGIMAFNPAGTIGVDYIYTNGPTVLSGSTTTFGLTIPPIYKVNCISFLPSNYIALGLGSSGIGNSSQIADVILWNPDFSTYETPLRLYSQAAANSAGINQIINRNNVLYCVTGGNHAIFSTNGSSFTLLEDISLHTTSRLINGGVSTQGKQSTAPIFINQYPSAIAVSGNKLYTGVSTSVNSNPEGYGIFPLGIWSEAITPEGNILQCEFTISTGAICGNSFKLGALYPINQAQLLIGWFDGNSSSYGIDQTSFLAYQTLESDMFVEGPMMEIGTPLTPTVIQNIQYNLVRNLLNGQQIDVSWRTGFDQNYQIFPNGSGTFNSQSVLTGGYKITKNPIGATRYIQLLTQMSTGGNVGGLVTINGTTTVTGNTTIFTSLSIGDYITIGEVTQQITNIVNDTNLTVGSAFGNASNQPYYINLNFTPQIRNIIIA